MKRLLMLLLLLMLPLCALADVTQGALDVLEGLDTEQLSQRAEELLGESLSSRVGAILSGKEGVGAQELLQRLWALFKNALGGGSWMLLRLLAPCALCGIADAFKPRAGGEGVMKAARTACFLLIATYMAQDLQAHVSQARAAIEGMAELMQTLFPLLLTLLAAVGGAGGAAFYQPAVVAACGTMTALIRNVSLRFALGHAMLTIVSHTAENARISRMTAFFKTVSTWTLGVSFTVFISVTALRGLSAAAVDGVSIRTAKYAVDNFVPVVGGMFADTMDTLVGCSLLIKNALGLSGLAMLLLYAAAPMCQTLAGVMVYRVAAALMEPVADERITQCVHGFSNALLLFFIIELSVCAMFVLLVAQMLVMGNLTVMLR